ncbi:LPS-assembly protein LptD [Amphiplicatus metriothermophilus]|uniref:LPS-assembly protein LptD n=1 Tax=Amphiplicatus metriothermophilus TaxID=1519374 RepID=A0A239PXZ2_9PROT|nr:LPS assembly protein LptD [Amphiplicatus metriothermophilus]MBB5519792.1 LPS-assembly protein [Amphiplicatus metriothermophilus]SNT75179.1 LPS-assembly protein [Amphiplicatus metriothermophilus]
MAAGDALVVVGEPTTPASARIALIQHPAVAPPGSQERLAPGEISPPSEPPPEALARTSGEEEEVLFEADFVMRESEDSPIVAEGNVRAYFGERYLRADRLTYDPQTDIVVAEGQVSITDKSLETAFADRVEITGDLRDGIAENFSALLAEGARLAADEAIREQGARTRLSHAVYTTCEVCKANGEGKTPTWRVKALRVTRDEERKVVRFRHAFFEIKGVPILYMPFLQAPDPSVERQSGFLTPVIGASSRLGFNLELPYYLALSNHQDATFSPKYTTNDGMLWQGEYRRRDISGYHVVQAGVIDFDNTKPDEDGRIPVGIPGVRWHIFAKGHRDFGDNWRAGYDIERVSDNTYLRRYDVERRGDLRQEIDTSRTNRLRSNVYGQWRSGGSRLLADAYLFQGLRQTDDSGLTPYVLPLIDFRHDFQTPVVGGRASVNANFASLQRSSGVDSRRFTASAYWEREHITRGGHRFHMFAEMRADAFYYADLDEGTEICSDPTDACADDNPWILRNDPTDFDARFAPSAGLEWSYPLTRRAGPARLFIEPRVQLVASPANRNSAHIINEDSQSIEFDYAGLFDYNKATGFDAFEDGQRMNAGVAASAVFNNGLSIEASVGEQFRLQDTRAFDPSTGLGEKRSDIVGSLDIGYRNVVNLENRFRFDDDDGSLQRAESIGRFSLWRFSGSVSYVRLNEENAAADLVKREELTGRMRVRLTDNWSVGGAWRENLVADRTIRQDFIIGYQDDCATFEITYRRDQTRDVGLGTDNAVLIRFTLRSLVQ